MKRYAFPTVLCLLWGALVLMGCAAVWQTGYRHRMNRAIAAGTYVIDASTTRRIKE
jgi:hypothetical protein